jgi:hypothetical protein
LRLTGRTGDCETTELELAFCRCGCDEPTSVD